MPSDEEQGLLAAHARAERVHAARVDAQPGNCCLHDARHPREVFDLSGIAPGEAFESPALAVGIDDCEWTERGEVPPAIDVLLGRDAPAAGGGDQRERWVVARPVPVREYDVRGSAIAVVGAVVDRDDPHLHSFPAVPARRTRRRAEAGEGEHDRQATQTHPSHRAMMPDARKSGQRGIP